APPGEFILGYESADGDPRPHEVWMKNGSFHVFRRLTLDRERWRNLVGEMSEKLGVDRDFAVAKLIGRWPDGTPLAQAKDPEAKRRQDERAQQTRKSINEFTYDGDPVGDTTPLFAHIRKMNPRTGRVDQKRIIRRSLPYGTDSECGLLFHAFMAS